MCENFHVYNIIYHVSNLCFFIQTVHVKTSMVFVKPQNHENFLKYFLIYGSQLIIIVIIIAVQ